MAEQGTAKEFQMFEETPEITPGGDPPVPAKKPGEEEPPAPPAPAKKPGEEEPPVPPAKKPEDQEPQEPPIPKEAEPHLARMRRAHKRELEIAELKGRNKVLEELVAKGVKVPAAGDKPAGDKPAGQDGDVFVYTVPRPTRDTFDGTEVEYEDAVLDWRDRRRTAEQQFNARKTQAADQKKKGDELYEKMHTDAVTRYPDYDEKVNASAEQGIQVNQQVAQAIQRFGGKYMADLIYHFATHPEEVKKVNAAEDPFDAVEDLRDAIALEQKQSGKPRRSNTPPPPPRLEADTGAGGIDLNDPKLSPEERIGGWQKEREREAAGKKK